MNNIEKSLKKTSKLITPNNKKFIKELIKEERKTNTYYLKLVPVAIILFVLGVFILNNNITYYKATIDVNPSIELTIKKNETIKEVKSLNKDGDKILKNLKLNNIDLNTGLNAIIGSMYKYGYITENNNSLLLSLNNNNKKIEDTLINYINNIIKDYNINPSLISINTGNDAKLHELSVQYGITEGKAELIQNILLNNNKRTFEDLVPLTIQELNLILNEKTSNKEIKIEKNERVNISGNVSKSEYLEEKRVLEIIKNKEQLTDKDIIYYEIEFDYEFNRIVYEIELRTNTNEYDYEVDAKTGEILKREIENEIDDDIYEEHYTQPNSIKTTKKVSNNNVISKDKALSIALKNANLNKSDIIDIEIDYNYEDDYNKYIYEISFKNNKYEYDYEIDAKTGKILKKDKELD